MTDKQSIIITIQGGVAQVSIPDDCDWPIVLQDYDDTGVRDANGASLHVKTFSHSEPPCLNCGQEHTVCPQCMTRRVRCGTREGGMENTWCDECDAEEREIRVTWTIEVSAKDRHAAAEQALKIMRDPSSIATVFEIEGELIELD